MPERESDHQLIDRIQNRDERAIEELQRRYRKVVHSACRQVFTYKGLHTQLTFDYKELIPDVESVLWSELVKSIQEGKSSLANAPKKIIAQAARNQATNLVRKSLRRRKAGNPTAADLTFPRLDELLESEPESLVHDQNPESIYLDDDLATRLVEKMTERQRRALEMTLDGMRRHQVAAELGVTEKTVYSDLKAARAKFDELLQD
ncbi:sigma-70 family RNA polymerase sigma factor [Proteobacteria bacterium 005FR1]|nr:sigma-70 family RNA polymerase sigma factor [Proteobacteria bacterium 005FR1]